MPATVIRVEHLSKSYRLGQIGTGTLTNDLKVWWAKLRGQPNPLLKIGQVDHGNRDGEELWALRDVSFEVEQGEVLGIIGRNGAGKSTLLKILSRVTAPTSGLVKVRGRIASLLEVGTGFHPELTGRENIYLNGAILGMSREEVRRKFDEVVAFAEVERFVDTPVKRYSSGMYVRLAFAVAAHLEPEILLVDEVLAVGDAEFQKKCLGKMGDVAREGRTVLFVSHNMAAVEGLCTKAILLSAGQIQSIGNVRNTIERYFDKNFTGQKIYPNGPVRKVSAKQDGSDLVIEVSFTLDREINYPGLGFVVSDHVGYSIFGTNAMMDHAFTTQIPRKEGTIRAVIRQPKLYNGKYRLSIWFGDGLSDFFVDKDCIEFEIVNMTSLSQPAASTSGAIHPLCEWVITNQE